MGGATKCKNPSRGGSLIICPLIALSQWKSEIEKFTEPNTFSICIYHGTKKERDTLIQKLGQYDIVLTTYQMLEQDFRRMISPNKVTCPNCNHKFKIDKLRVHLKYLCGADAQKTEAQSRQQRTRDFNNDPEMIFDSKNEKYF